MRKAVLLIILLKLFFCYNTVTAQEETFKLIKFGIKGFSGLTRTTHLNTITDEWIEKAADASNAELEGYLISIPFNLEYGYQPFVGIKPIKFLQIGMKFDFSHSRLSRQFENPLLNHNYELNFRTKSYIPGIFTYLTLGKFEFGGSLLYSYSNVYVNDDFFGYQDTWYGNNVGYELILGFSSSKRSLVGFTMAMKYRSLVINDLNDTQNRGIHYSDSQKNMSLDMSGFIIEMGLYFQVVKMGAKKNES